MNHWNPKTLREHICQQQTWAPDRFTSDLMQALIHVLDLHRPIGPDGNHGARHTPTCGCPDRYQPNTSAGPPPGASTRADHGTTRHRGR